MPFQNFLPLTVCAVSLILTGCVAAPLAQVAVSQMMPAKPSCVAGPGCQTGGAADGSFGGMSKGVSDVLRKMTTGRSEDPDQAGTVRAK